VRAVDQDTSWLGFSGVEMAEFVIPIILFNRQKCMFKGMRLEKTGSPCPSSKNAVDGI
jgi:hypothetical protein